MMKAMERIPDEMFVCGSLFVVTNLLDTCLERELAEFNTTTKQWLLSIAVQTLFDTPPSLNEAAKAMGTSYQNVKQIALKLQAKSLLLLVPDTKDARITRLVMTEQFHRFWGKTVEKGSLFAHRLFANVSAEELATVRKVLTTLWGNLEA